MKLMFRHESRFNLADNSIVISKCKRITLIFIVFVVTSCDIAWLNKQYFDRKYFERYENMELCLTNLKVLLAP